MVLTMHSPSEEHVLDTADLPVGTYIVRFTGKGRVASAKFVKE